MQNKIRTIIIDDEEEGRYILQSMLSKFPEIEIIAVSGDAESGLDVINRLKPDLVFLDIRMPQISGIDLAKQLIENQIYTSIVFVTAYDKFGVQAIKLAAFDYLLKPVDPDEIQRVISRYKKRKKPDNL
jgi:two-component system LytT family response regulator